MVTLNLQRELTIEKSADEVWDYLSDLHNAMTVNQFHVGVDYDGGGKQLKRGLVVPLHHDFFGYKHVRMATLQIYGDRSIGWGERHGNPDEDDPFPHSEAWRVEPAGEDRCIIRTSLRGSFRWGPLAAVLSEYLWSLMIPPILDTDLRELAYRVGAADEPPTLKLPPEQRVINRLMAAREVDGQPVEKLLADFMPEVEIKTGVTVDPTQAFIPVAKR